MYSTPPLISVCMPTHNGEKFIGEALISIKNQTYKNIEVVISDDNSSDGTLLLCRQFKNQVDFPVYISNHVPCGIGANWNNCIKHAKGEYIKLLFQDDLFLANTLERQLYDIKKSNFKAICSKRIIIDENSEEVLDGEWIEKYGNLQQNLSLPEQEVVILEKNIFNLINDYTYNYFGEPDTFLYHNSVFKDIGLFNNDYKQIIDLEFNYRLFKRFPILHQKDKLLKFRIHDDQESKKNQKLNLPEYDKLRKWVKHVFFWHLSRSEKLKIIKNRFLI